MSWTRSLCNRILLATVIAVALFGAGLVLLCRYAWSVAGATAAGPAVAVPPGAVGEVLLVALPAWLAIGLALHCWLRWQVGRPLRLFAAQLQELAAGEGDPTRRPDDPGTAELRAIAAAFDAFCQRIFDMIAQIHGHGSAVDRAARNIASESHRLADGAAQSAATIEEIHATLQEIGNLAQSTTANCLSASNSAGQAASAAVVGDAASSRMNQAMAAIQESSQAVRSVIEIIQDVAFQTNLLALNAAVEAARAGDAGRGFAVVADEVRSLAQRSTKAAQETASLVGDAAQRAEHGARIAAEVANAFAAITQQTGTVHGLLQEVAKLAAQQGKNVEQVANGVTSLSQATQDNAAGAQELAVTAKESAARVDSLRQMMAAFRMGATATAD